MRLDTEKILKALILSCLVVALVAIKPKLEESLDGQDLFLKFIYFLISLFVLSIVELLFEKVSESNWLKKLFNKSDYIEGWWLNYATDMKTPELYNFALITIDRVEDQIHLSGWTFRVTTTNNQEVIEPDGHFYSTMAQYQSENGRELVFNFTVDYSDIVRRCRHPIIGSARYFFGIGHGAPTAFVGEFSTEKPQMSFGVTGHRLSKIDQKSLKAEGGLHSKYQKALAIARSKDWIHKVQFSSRPQKARGKSAQPDKASTAAADGRSRTVPAEGGQGVPANGHAKTSQTETGQQIADPRNDTKLNDMKLHEENPLLVK